MIRRIQLLRNIGQFDSVDAGAQIKLGRLVLIYAENGRGKTTLAAVLRSLANGDPTPIMERHRLGAANPPHAVLECDGGPSDAVFQEGAWNRTLPHLELFDDVFVDENIYSGLAVDAQHRQNLHELILGTQGVNLSRKFQQLAKRAEKHIKTRQEKDAAIQETVREGLDVDEFCKLPELPDVDAEIEATERKLAATQEQDAIKTTPLFETLTLPAFNTEAIDKVLQRDLLDLDAKAEAQVKTHLATLGVGGEQWLNDGMQRLPQTDEVGTCPFCAQDLTGSALIAHYRSYFGATYRDFKQEITDALESFKRTHAGDVSTEFERAIRVAGERRAFWSRFCEVPDVDIDTAPIVSSWNSAREAVRAALVAKQAAPLEKLALDRRAKDAIEKYEASRKQVDALNDALVAANKAIIDVQKKAANANPGMIAQDLSRLKATKARHTPEIATKCTAYLVEKEAEAETKREREEAKHELDDYRKSTFPMSEETINTFLHHFGANFKLGSVTSKSTRGRPTCTYNVVINENPVSIGVGTPKEGEPSFRNTLSSGDRNTLALAFFFASLKQDPELSNAIVVIDDPISSLDDHRSLVTVQEVRKMSERASQVIVLSHNKRFLCEIWKRADTSTRVALEIAQDRTGSTLRQWDVDQESVQKHIQIHRDLREYVASGAGKPRQIAESIRPHLEAFFQFNYPDHFPPGTLLGRFLEICRQREGQKDEILDADTTQELAALVEYANQFHHDTGSAWDTGSINKTELQGFVKRTLAFTRRRSDE